MSDSSNPPTLAGYQSFVLNIMGISTSILPADSSYIAWSFAVAMTVVNPALNFASSALPGLPSINIFALAVYNLAGDYLLNWAQDAVGAPIYKETAENQGLPFFAYMRYAYNLNGFVPGVITSSSDADTSQALVVPEALKTLMLSDLQNLKTPYGRQYLAWAQRYGTLWGLT